MWHDDDDVMTPEGVTYRRNTYCMYHSQNQWSHRRVKIENTVSAQTTLGAEATPVQTTELTELRRSGRDIKTPQRLIEQM